MPAPPALPFSRVLIEEKIEIDAARALREQPPLSKKPELSALAFSGGGIRSAVFNLGILQGLAKHNLLRQLDYLSTVSGGGYISGWLVGWMRRAGCKPVEQRLQEDAQPAPPSDSERYLEPDQVRFLRRYATYLAPNSGLLSADTWTMVAIYLRNMILNFTLLVLFGAGVLLLPDIALWFSHSAWMRGSEVWLWPLTLAFIAFAAVTVGIGLGGLSNDSPARRGWRSIILFHEGAFAPVPLFLAAISGSLLLRSLPLRSLIDPLMMESGLDLAPWIYNTAIFYTAAWTLALLIRQTDKKGQYPQPVAGGVPGWIITIAATVVIGMFQGYLFYWVARLFIFLFQAASAAGDPQWMRAAVLVLGPLLLVSAFLLAVVFHIGLAGRAMPDALREWAARAAAILSLITVGWLALFGASLYGPPLVHWVTTSDWAVTQWGKVFKWLLGAAWAAVTTGGVVAGKSSATKNDSGGGFGWLTKIAPPVFIVGFVLLLSYGVDLTLPRLPTPDNDRAVYAHQENSASQQANNDANSAVNNNANNAGNNGATTTPNPASSAERPESRDLHYFAQRHWERVQKYQDSRLLLYLVICGALVLILEWRVDVNEFSMHLFYRNRLTRTFLGASQNQRVADPFTGFSEDDDIALKDLTTNTLRWRDPLDPCTQPESKDNRYCLGYDGPFPIFCTALNEVRGKELAWRTRKATSFIYTPLYCGYDYFSDPPATGKYSPCAYRPTGQYSREDGPMIGTAMAVSGAAASPNMGYHTSPALAFMMALFNVRLGWWAGNPRHPRTWRRYGPWWGLLYLLKEVFPDTSDEMAYVYLSDGGHFENLGVYELIRRQCRFIICSDADCDPDSTFDNLGSLVEKCRSDFGVEIDIDIENLKRDDDRISKAHFAVGNISYRDGSNGALLYIKPTLTGDEPEDVKAYAAKNHTFPHDTTANQFFDESQFESYRALGEHIFNEIYAVGTQGHQTPAAATSQPFPISQLLMNLWQLQQSQNSGQQNGQQGDGAPPKHKGFIL